MMDNKEFKISFGMLAPTIHEQLIEQGLSSPQATQHQNARKCVDVLFYSGYLTEAEAGKVRKRLFSAILKEVSK